MKTAYQFPEERGPVELTVLREGVSGDVEVHWKTVNNTAKEGVDYRGANGTIMFADQQARARI